MTPAIIHIITYTYIYIYIYNYIYTYTHHDTDILPCCWMLNQFLAVVTTLYSPADKIGHNKSLTSHLEPFFSAGRSLSQTLDGKEPWWKQLLPSHKKSGPWCGNQSRIGLATQVVATHLPEMYMTWHDIILHYNQHNTWQVKLYKIHSIVQHNYE